MFHAQSFAVSEDAQQSWGNLLEKKVYRSDHDPPWYIQGQKGDSYKTDKNQQGLLESKFYQHPTIPTRRGNATKQYISCLHQSAAKEQPITMRFHS